MSPASERPVPTKKSLRIWVRNNGHVQRKQRVTYRYPRTVEAAQDPFVCQDGKNKMFYLIAINLFPDSKIVKPDDSDSDSDVDQPVDFPKEDAEISSIQPMIKAPPIIARIKRKYKKRRAQSDIPTQIQTMTVMTDLHNCEKISETDEPSSTSTDENVSQTDFTPPVAFSQDKTKRKGAQRIRKNLKILYKNNENKTACSAVLGYKRTPSKTDLLSPPPKPNSSKLTMKKMSPSFLRQATPPTIPNIMSSLQKVIRSCSETGLVSFNLPKEPCQS